MIQDLHAHTYYSFDSQDKIEKVVETTIANGIELLGITDHNYGIAYPSTEMVYDKGPALDSDYGSGLLRYYDHMKLIKEKYKNRIKILSGIEVATLICKERYALPDKTDISYFDYCLVENLDNVNHSTVHGDIFSFAKRCGCPTGIAHTDMFKFISDIGEEPNSYFRKMAANNIFWEINVNYDSLHGFHIHEYVTDFFKDKTQQDIVKKSGVKLSVGFDSHRINEYKADRVKTANKLIKDMGIKLMFDNL